MISGLFPTLPEDNAPDPRPDFIVELIPKKARNVLQSIGVRRKIIMMIDGRKNIVGPVQNPIDERAKLTSNAPLHVFDGLYFVVTKMVQRRVGIGGHGLTKLAKYACLVRPVVRPKGLIGLDCLGYNQRSE
jgi:hypothetical protein